MYHCNEINHVIHFTYHDCEHDFVRTRNQTTFTQNHKEDRVCAHTALYNINPWEHAHTVFNDAFTSILYFLMPFLPQCQPHSYTDGQTQTQYFYYCGDLSLT